MITSIYLIIFSDFRDGLYVFLADFFFYVVLRHWDKNCIFFSFTFVIEILRSPYTSQYFNIFMEFSG